METSQKVDNPWPGAVVQLAESTSSTMDDARDLARRGCASGSVVCTRFQERGRGRVPGRTWISPPGESLLATVIVLKRDVGFPLYELPLRAGLAAALAVEIASGVAVEIKWPNDLMVADRKLGGILCEAGGDALLVGIGVNLLQKSFPPEIESTACSLLQASGCAVDASILLSTFLGQLRESLHDDAWRGRLLDRFMARGRHVRVELLGSGGAVEGTIAGLDDRGRLILQANDGREILIEQGEIVTGPL